VEQPPLDQGGNLRQPVPRTIGGGQRRRVGGVDRELVPRPDRAALDGARDWAVVDVELGRRGFRPVVVRLEVPRVERVVDQVAVDLGQVESWAGSRSA
jgi:ABC-type uncharacterized transport system YnjBCD ATPase subunit